MHCFCRAKLIALVAVIAWLAIAAVGAKAADVTEADARALLTRFLDPAADRASLTGELQPFTEDYAAAYKEPVATRLEQIYANLWGTGVAIGPKPGQTELLVTFATTDQLIAGEPVLAEFPGGYKAVLPHLKPGNAIVRFKFVEPGETIGMAFDGLIHVNGHWVLIPKPWLAAE
ncbi:hypothetical protein [Rhodobium gokarnense]|uniref:DUF3887 domain-containing protein n=1 Tax=Rhodobium gokarnense TaxID=364296 RepID=A0ABT3HA68_9HYPH|nr:hypothetical protein [Rhodobium gokarnense]MCW2307296.1 hypothetical protein [Rhodobium gokarnense]